MSNEPSPVDFLKAVYLNEGLPLSVRMRAAIEAAPYLHPKLSATAILQGDGFAERLERAIVRSGMVIRCHTSTEDSAGPMKAALEASRFEKTQSFFHQ